MRTISIWKLLIFLAVFNVSSVCFGQSSTSSNPKEINSAVVCTCINIVSIGINLTQKPKKEITLSIKELLKNFKIYEDGVLQELEYIRINNDAVTKKIGFRYKIGYAPENDKNDGRVRKIRITTKFNRRRAVIIHQSIDNYIATEENRRRLRFLPTEEVSSSGCCN
jgi:hypothetical protein